MEGWTTPRCALNCTMLDKERCYTILSSEYLAKRSPIGMTTYCIERNSIKFKTMPDTIHDRLTL